MSSLHKTGFCCNLRGCFKYLNRYLLYSTLFRDWVKITEMFLGKVKPDFQFLPKHKANSYS